ncbi:hypothetical protein PS623_04681 [Pseudomonas fluorescens]|uniref:StbB family protein n=1 Tax=Pseudomonas fluorescens TaxID=294 RepID=UPI001242DD34|nr:StbB family protein [Pseudomonas fluorescens]VVN28966.1 hypothetical protein PS623_04681 [Pseudomonas fluorescens]
MSHIVVINRSGNTGKSTASDHMIAPRFNGAEVLRIESINSHEGDDTDNLRGDQYGQILRGIAILPASVIDVGSSNAEDFVNYMKQYAGSHEVFDTFVVPTVAKPKQMKDTIKTIDALSDLGVPASKIRVLFNMVEGDDTELEEDFGPIFAFFNSEKKFTLNTKAVIYTNDFYSDPARKGLTVDEILKDKTDFNALLVKAETQQEKMEISERRALKFLATGLKVQLDNAFAATFG